MLDRGPHRPHPFDGLLSAEHLAAGRAVADDLFAEEFMAQLEPALVPQLQVVALNDLASE